MAFFSLSIFLQGHAFCPPLVLVAQLLPWTAVGVTIVYCPGYTPPKVTVLSSHIKLGTRGRAGLLRMVIVQSIVQSDGTSAFVRKRGALA